jgi:hypothetical protein
MVFLAASRDEPPGFGAMVSQALQVRLALLAKAHLVSLQGYRLQPLPLDEERVASLFQPVHHDLKTSVML